MYQPEFSINTPITRYFQLDRRDLAYLTFILDAYEGLATLSTVEKKDTLVSITTFPGATADLDRLITALQGEITLTEKAPPPDDRAAGGDDHDA
jgi:hypothetical protein